MQNILDYLTKAAAEHPEKTALSDSERSYTYKELNEKAKLIGSFLVSKADACPKEESGKEPSPIAVIARHDAFTLLAFFGILQSGNFYVPLDPKSPPEKLEKIFADSGAEIVLGRQEDASLLPPSFQGSFFVIEDMKAEADPVFPGADADACAPLYMIYTSGSTGYPKGVLKTHGAVIDFVETYADTFDFSSDEIIGNQTPFFFDASAKDIYLCLKLGATMEIIPDGMFTLPPSLIRYMNEKKITFISWVPSALCVITQLNTFEEVIPETVKKIFFVGESFPIKQFKKWQAALPDAEYVNLYGASELAGICCYYKVPNNIGDIDRIPIGKPLKNCDILLMEKPEQNDSQEDCGKKDDTICGPLLPEVITETHKTGEIWLSSKALFKEYYNDPEKTNASTVYISGKRYFKTGDLAWYDEDFNLNFATRNDSQIKHMGQRIELGEIETVCSGLDEIEKCCCLYKQDKKRIYLFCQLTEGTECGQKELLIKLKERLVSYMMPQRVVIKDKLPLNANGKIDRQLLKEEM